MSTGNHAHNTYLIKRISHCLILSILITFSPSGSHAFEILMGTGAKGSFSYFTGKTICRLISMEPDLSCKTLPAPDNTHNLTNLRSGLLDIALVDSRMLHDAFNSTGYFEFLDISYENLKILAPLYTVPVVLLARDDAKIHSLDNLQGKRFNIGPPLSLQHLTADTILQAKGWTEKDFRLVEELPTGHSQDTLAFSSGTVQTMLHIGIHPDPKLQHLLKRSKASLIDMDDPDIDKLVRDHKAFTKVSIPAQTYSTNPDGVNTFGTQVILVTSEDLDDTTVRSILTAIFQNKEKLKKAHPSLSAIRKGETWKLNGEIQPHPEAIKYFQEKKL